MRVRFIGTPPSITSPRLSAALAAMLALFGAVGCPSRDSMGVRAISLLGPGVINDPANKSLRFDLLKFGLDQFCAEMRDRGAPLKLRDGEPVLGRFFATGCNSQIIDDESRESFIVQYAGTGYGWTNLTGRLAFQSSGLVEYDPDFQLQNGALYVYFRPRNVASASFQTLLVESALAQTGIAVTSVNPDQLGRDIVDGQLKRGFTVIRYSSNGETDFGMGVVPVGSRPFRPFIVQSEDKVTLDDDSTEVHSNQQDVVGGLVVPNDNQALYLTMQADGAPAVDVFVIGKDEGDKVVDRLAHTPGPTTLTAPPLFGGTVVSGSPWKQVVPVPKGTYYLLLDNSSALGQAAPPAVQGDDRAARVDYVVEVGDRP
ncbi:MAG TPA: hypothetical protein VHC69_04415 [Polyangiaceae bacterium]|nr:hypothetical protein [Polyangiaceae bacterium]